MRLLVLVTDAFGGHGGIAKFNRDMISASSSHLDTEEVTVLMRLQSSQFSSLPSKVNYRTSAAGSKWNFVASLVRQLWENVSYDAVICGHINLLPVAAIASWWTDAPLVLITHGFEAWASTNRLAVNKATDLVDTFVSVSEYTKERFLGWTSLSAEQGRVVPDCVDLSKYGPGPKREDLLHRYGIQDRTVLLTLSRLAPGRYKGHDQVLEQLPALAEEVPDLVYLIAGDGDDRERLEKKARRLGLSERVVFAGYVDEEEKADHYRLADAFVMIGHTEGFGIAYLEAMACGIPVVASTADASQEAVSNGELGKVVDPDDPQDVRRGLREALGEERGVVPEGLERFSYGRFEERWHDVLDSLQ